MCGFFQDASNWVDKHSKRFQSFADDITGLGNGKGVSSYSDFVNIANTYTDGWYGTIADSLPIAGNIHRSILGRDRTNDMLNNSGQSWADVLGYNSSGTISGGSPALGHTLGQKMEDGKNDLFEFYTGVKDNQRVGLGWNGKYKR